MRDVLQDPSIHEHLDSNEAAEKAYHLVPQPFLYRQLREVLLLRFSLHPRLFLGTVTVQLVIDGRSAEVQSDSDTTERLDGRSPAEAVRGLVL